MDYFLLFFFDILDLLCSRFDNNIQKKKNIVMAVIITVIAICGSLSGLLIMIVIIFTVIY